jgi:hypothetical protein
LALVQVRRHLAIAPKPLRQALPAARRARPEERSQPELGPHGLHQQPGPARRERRRVERAQPLAQVVVGQHHRERVALADAQVESCQHGHERLDRHPAKPDHRDRRLPQPMLGRAGVYLQRVPVRRPVEGHAGGGFDDVALVLEERERVVDLGGRRLVRQGID